MGDRRDRLFLQNGRRAEQRAGRDKQDIAISSAAEISEDMPAQYRRAASASRSARVDVLTVVKDHHAAVLMLCRDIDPFFQHQVTQQLRSDTPQITRKDRVIIINIRIRRAKKPIYGVRRSR